MNKKFKKFSNPVIMPTQQEMQMLNLRQHMDRKNNNGNSFRLTYGGGVDGGGEGGDGGGVKGHDDTPNEYYDDQIYILDILMLYTKEALDDFSGRLENNIYVLKIYYTHPVKLFSHFSLLNK